MRDYQPKAARDLLPQAVYMKTIYQIRDYYRLKENIDDMVTTSKDPMQPVVTGGGKSSPVESAAIKREEPAYIVKMIDDALEHIPEEYRKGVWQAVMYHSAYPGDAASKTYTQYKTEFIYRVAVSLGFI